MEPLRYFTERGTEKKRHGHLHGAPMGACMSYPRVVLLTLMLSVLVPVATAEPMTFEIPPPLGDIPPGSNNCITLDPGVPPDVDYGPCDKRGGEP